MRNKWLHLLLAATLLLCACQAPKPQLPDPTALPTPEQPSLPAIAVLTDMLGREFPLKGTPQRVVSLSPATTEILFALNKGGAVAAADAGSDYPAEALSLTKADPANIEEIAALSPDVVFVSRSIGSDAIAALEQKGLVVVCAEAETYSDLYASIALVAQVMETDAAPLVQSIQQAVREVTAQAAELDETPSVYFALSVDESGLTAAGPDSFAYSLIQMAGGAPVTATATQPMPQYSIEDLQALAPQVVLVSSALDMEALSRSDAFKDLAAVQEGRMYMVDEALLSRPGPRAALGMQEVYGALEMSLNG